MTEKAPRGEPLLRPPEGYRQPAPAVEPTCIEFECPVCSWEQELIVGDKPRSGPHHRHFFAMIRAAYFHWPHDHPVQFDKHSRKIGETEARKWLLAKVGHADLISRVPVTGIGMVAANALAREILAQSGADTLTIPRGGDLLILRPKSIAERRCPTKVFTKVADDVRSYIEAKCGAPIDELIARTPAPPKRRKPQ